jgi:hypothetical protein
VVDWRRGESFFHQQVIHQLCLADTLEMRQPGSVSQNVAHGDVGFAVGPELRPVLSDRRVVTQQLPVDEPMDHRRRDAFGRGEHHRAGVGRPGHFALAV